MQSELDTIQNLHHVTTEKTFSIKISSLGILARSVPGHCRTGPSFFFFFGEKIRIGAESLPLTIVSLSVGEHLAMTRRGAQAESKAFWLIFPFASKTLALNSLPSKIAPARQLLIVEQWASKATSRLLSISNDHCLLKIFLKPHAGNSS